MTEDVAIPESEIPNAEEVLDQSPASIAREFEGLPLPERLAFWHSIEKDSQLDILTAMRGDTIEWITEQLPEEDLRALFTSVDAFVLIELFDHLPDQLIAFALENMSLAQKTYFDTASHYSDTEVGHWVSFEMPIVSSKMRLREVKRVLRRLEDFSGDYIYIVDKERLYLGAFKISNLIFTDEMKRVDELEMVQVPTVSAKDNPYEIGQKILDSGLVAAPVLNETGHIIGILDHQIAYAFIKEQHEAEQMSRAGLDEDTDLFTPARKSAKQRALWLGLNLLTAFLAAWFIGLFESTLQQVVALAVLMPIVASMGGIAGSQSLALIIRGLALDQVDSSNTRALLTKELTVALLNGFLWAGVVGVITLVWFGDMSLAAVIAAAILVNMLAAAFFGVMTPVVLNAFKLDPALSGSVVLTTFTDVIGFVVFLGLGSLFLV